MVFADTAGGAYKMFKGGYFTFDDMAPVQQYAIEHGLMMGAVDFEPRSPRYLDDILLALKSGSKAAMKPFLTSQHQENVAKVARDNINSISHGMIKYIEDTLKISLTVENEELDDIK